MPDAVGSDPPRAPGAGAATALPPDLTGRTLGDFQLLRRLGSGGMGQVYLARQLSLKREVAVKLLRNDLADNPTALKRFQAEAEAVARLSHSHIVQVYAVGEHDGLRYMALEYVDGRNLRDYLDRKGPPDLPITLSIVRQVSSALHRAHEHGIVHRDIKPENILVTRKVEVKVTDFGLSRYFAGVENVRLTQSGVTVGTPLYISPEQAQGHPVDHRSDIYSFGVTCYHLLCGEPPFKGMTAVEVALKHVTEPPPPLAEFRPDLPSDLCVMVHRMMAKNPVDRFQSAREVSRELARIRSANSLGTVTTAPLEPGQGQQPGMANQPHGAEPAGSGSGSETFVIVEPARRAWAWALAGLVCMFAAAAGAFLYVLISPPAEAAGIRPADQPPLQGLSDVPPPEPLTTARERELLAVASRPEAPAEDRLAATVGLGLLYVKERRLPEANDRFRDLQAPDRFPGAVTASVAQTAGRFGQAVVLAYANRPEESNALFLEAIGGKGGDPKSSLVRTVRSRYPNLAWATTEALNRNAANLGTPSLTPVLEHLRALRVGMQPE